ncbi:MAG: class I SAM-dependent methyltransferase [Gammaproteobacteria bacterium]|nr:MAG: class I SAM-dependent methyltransferase [Gammaproteobacteria bacterium]RLA60176.1 MAG: class I SAM-dependent methyltransferase [Gammaproteobacteria bacterium]
MSNSEQIEYWNGEAGERWAREDETMARLLHPVSTALLDHAAIEGCLNALDIGCGGGSQSMMLAARLGPNARVLGLDISEPMLEVAHGKIAGIGEHMADTTFLHADAATHTFETNDFDLIFSRFGVMFFDDPAAAFSNIRKALRSQARLAFSCWQSLQDNDWARIPLRVALQHLPPPEAQDPHAPGPFALADPQRVEAILQASGFRDIAVESFARDIRFGEASTLSKSVRKLVLIGPVGRLIAGQEPDVLERIFTSMEEVLAPYYREGALHLPVAIWFVTATTD